MENTSINYLSDNLIFKYVIQINIYRFLSPKVVSHKNFQWYFKQDFFPYRKTNNSMQLISFVL